MSLAVEPNEIMTDKNAEHAYLFLYNPDRLSVIADFVSLSFRIALALFSITVEVLRDL